jgi:flagellar basal-body rod modification protein FlgD
MQIDSSVLSPSSALDTTPAAGTAPSTASSTATNAAIASTSGLGNEDTFLQLLVAQIQNQDPTQPIDTTTFLTQLASFSQLEQLIGINQGVSQLETAATAAAGTSNGTSTGTTGTSSTQNS